MRIPGLSLLYSIICVLPQSLSGVRLFVTRWTVACQAPLSMGFSRQEYWSGLPFPPPGVAISSSFQGMPFPPPSWPRDWTRVSCISCIADGFLTTEPPGEVHSPWYITTKYIKSTKFFKLLPCARHSSKRPFSSPLQPCEVVIIIASCSRRGSFNSGRLKNCPRTPEPEAAVAAA